MIIIMDKLNFINPKRINKMNYGNNSENKFQLSIVLLIAF